MTSSSERRRHLAVALAIAGLACSSVAHAGEAPIDASVAALYVGRDITVEGVVTAAERDGYVVRLQLGRPPQTLTVQLVLGMLSRFPDDPERYYLGKEVRVYGRVSEFRGKVEMIVREPDRIVAVDETGPGGVAPEHVRALEDRVRELEERLRTLETETPPAPGATP